MAVATRNGNKGRSSKRASDSDLEASRLPEPNATPVNGLLTSNGSPDSGEVLMDTEGDRPNSEKTDDNLIISEKAKNEPIFEIGTVEHSPAFRSEDGELNPAERKPQSSTRRYWYVGGGATTILLAIIALFKPVSHKADGGVEFKADTIHGAALINSSNNTVNVDSRPPLLSDTAEGKAIQRFDAVIHDLRMAGENFLDSYADDYERLVNQGFSAANAKETLFREHIHEIEKNSAGHDFAGLARMAFPKKSQSYWTDHFKEEFRLYHVFMENVHAAVVQHTLETDRTRLREQFEEIMRRQNTFRDDMIADARSLHP